MWRPIVETTEYISNRITGFRPDIGIVLGTGLGGLVGEMDIQYTLNYNDIPNFPISTVESHTGKLIFGTLGGKNVMAMQGRFHHYEGYSLSVCLCPTHPEGLTRILRSVSL